MTSSLSTRLKIGRGQDLSVEQRLELLERGFDNIQDKLQNDLQREVDLRTAAIVAERADREKRTDEIRHFHIRMGERSNENKISFGWRERA